MKAQAKFQDSEHFKHYWEKGNGRELLDWSGWEPSFQNFDRYAHLYYQTDSLGDAAVNDSYLKLPYHRASELVSECTKNPVTTDSTAPQSLKALFLKMQNIPEWFDADLADCGAELCMRSGTNALIILRDFTLMGGYDFAYLNKPLIFTGALKKGAVKRLKDTLEFWVQATRRGALLPHSEAYQLIVRTRLMHSYARISIKNKVPAWNYEDWGEPINHWDMLATYTGFSLVFMQGLRRLAVEISDEEEAGMYHLWKYIGYLLGIPAEFLPENKAQATELLYLWSSVQDKGDADSAQLARALLDENTENTIYKFKFQRNLLLRLHESMNWYLLDREINERLRIPKPGIYSVFPKMIINANKASQKIFNLNNKDRYQKLVGIGNRQQMQVLDDYIKHTPKDFHY